MFGGATTLGPGDTWMRDAVNNAMASHDVVDNIPDVMIIVSDGDELNLGISLGAIETTKRANIKTYVIGRKKDDGSANHGGQLTDFAHGLPANVANGDSSDALTGAVAQGAVTGAFNHICNAKNLCDPEPCMNGVCFTFTTPEGFLSEDCSCDSGYQDRTCDAVCDLGPDEKVDVSFVLDVSGTSNSVEVNMKDWLDDLGRSYETIDKVCFSIMTHYELLIMTHQFRFACLCLDILELEIFKLDLSQFNISIRKNGIRQSGVHHGVGTTTATLPKPSHELPLPWIRPMQFQTP